MTAKTVRQNVSAECRAVFLCSGCSAIADFKIERKYAEGHAAISIFLAYRAGLFSDIDNH